MKKMLKCCAAGAVALAAGALAVGAASPAGAVTISPADAVGTKLVLTNRVEFAAYQPHTWTSTSVHLSWQTDGNLVLYCNKGGKVLWASGTAGDTPAIIFFTGGAIAINSAAFNEDPDMTVWQTFTGGSDYAYVQNDGNFVIYNPNGHVDWATGTENKC